mgnify:CR=1 FL=1
MGKIIVVLRRIMLHNLAILMEEPAFRPYRDSLLHYYLKLQKTLTLNSLSCDRLFLYFHPFSKIARKS